MPIREPEKHYLKDLEKTTIPCPNKVIPSRIRNAMVNPLMAIESRQILLRGKLDNISSMAHQKLQVRISKPPQLCDMELMADKGIS